MYRVDWTDDRLQERFDSIDRRFDEVDRRFGEVDRRFDKLEHEVDRRFGKVEHEINRLHDRFDGLYRATYQVGAGMIAALIGVIATLIVTQ